MPGIGWTQVLPRGAGPSSQYKGEVRSAMGRLLPRCLGARRVGHGDGGWKEGPRSRSVN